VTLVTLSASYGAGGSVVGPTLAERLGVPFVDRAIPTDVAARLSVPLGEALHHDESVEGVFERILASIAPAMQQYAAGPIRTRTGGEFSSATEQCIHEYAERGEGVILGRGGQFVLRDDPRVMHVRLDGPRERRIAQGARIQGIDLAAAESTLEETDRARDAYLRHFYGENPCHANLYHVALDSTAIPLADCVEIIARAATAFSPPD
jgi:cytidylate kinase